VLLAISNNMCARGQVHDQRACCLYWQKYTRRLKQLNVRTLCPSQLYFGYSSQHSFSSSILSGLTPRIFRTVTDTSEHILFYFYFCVDVCIIRSHSRTSITKSFTDLTRSVIADINRQLIMFTMHKTLVTDWLTYVQNILQPSFVGPFVLVPLSFVMLSI